MWILPIVLHQYRYERRANNVACRNDNSDALFSDSVCRYYQRQVVMDILGVFLTVMVSGLILDTPIGQMLTSKLSFSS